jgi:hypothetical protein
MLLALIAALASAQPTPPGEIAVPDGMTLAQRAEGRGVQTYVCEGVADTPGRYAWRLLAPDATLTDADGKRIGRHFAGPTWQGVDGGQVVGQAKAKSPSPDGAIDWLLVEAKSNSGPGLFGRVRYVQRLATKGGLAPTRPCTGDNLGDQVRTPYSAEYDFYVPADADR